VTKICIDCDAPIYKTSTRCKTCSNKSRALPDRFCACGAKLSRLAKEKCLVCHNRDQDQGKSRERTKFNVSPQWAKARGQCFERDEFTCQDCGAVNGEGKAIVLNAHHIMPYCDYPDLRLNLDNLITLCYDCHREKHKGSGDAGRNRGFEVHSHSQQRDEGFDVCDGRDDQRVAC